jgi:glycosyltransferase involved in cell wall biosynthesis
MVDVSIIIPTYNRAQLLRACLEALSRQTQPTIDFEVVVVANGSSDGTAEMLANFSAPYTLRIVWQPNTGQAAALNHGIDAATGTYCLFLDDDIIAGPQLVAEHLRAGGGVIGLGHLSLTIPPSAGGFARGFAQWWDRHYAYLEQRAPSFADCFSGNMSAPRAALCASGGFATDLVRGFDVEIGYRLEQRGLRFVYIPQATGRQDYRKDFHEIVADADSAGSAGLELYRRHPPMLPHLHLSGFHNARFRTMLLRRAMLTLRVPIGPLKLVDPLVGQER